MVSAKRAGRYLDEYVERYQSEYRRFIAPAPEGGGYPAFPISSYVDARELRCYIAADGAVIADHSTEPPYPWYLSGGPGFLIGYPPPGTRRFTTMLIANHSNRFMLIDRLVPIVSHDPIADEVWAGTLPEPIEKWSEYVGISGTWIHVGRYELELKGLLQRLTLGAVGNILDVYVPRPGFNLWRPRVLSNLGFVTADRAHRRFFRHMEIVPHVDDSEWDTRAIWMRVYVDIRRAYARAFAVSRFGTGYIDFDSGSDWSSEPFYDRLTSATDAIGRFRSLLEGEHSEATYHRFLETHPILLDLYGVPESKPRWAYRGGGRHRLGKRTLSPTL